MNTLNSVVLKLPKAVISASTERGGRKLWILIFHRVLEQPDPLRPGETDQAGFERQMSLLAKYFNVLPLNDAVDALLSDTLPSRAAVVTFDDGYSDNLTHAAPILEKYGLPATIFVSTGFLDGGRMWNDTVIETVRLWPDSHIDLSHLDLGVMACDTVQGKQSTISAILNTIKHLEPKARQGIVDQLAENIKSLPTDLMLTTEGVRELHSRGFEIGAHTVNHPILASIDKTEAWQEIAESKKTLEEIIDEVVRFFAYPNGKFQSDYREEHTSMLHELGFKAAVATDWGVATPTTDIMQLPRFTPWDAAGAKYLYRAIRNYRDAH